ncbi:hypothetical protein OS493_020124 [Desmophyllum pertusum]|uniref:Uncharacterized protein n=1 Tax=Desmophyllum pertusum TaxID=174260 RepID=A0A9X0A0Y8_9CNID|nr:hypothetical protein OS493_020124 [Desmophyllum pertusum]
MTKSLGANQMSITCRKITITMSQTQYCHAQNHAVSDNAEGELVGDYDAEQSSDEDITEQNMSTRPQRQRRPPRILMYNSFGNPEYQCISPTVNSIQVPWMTPPAVAVPFGTPIYYWFWPQMPVPQPIYY